MTHWATIVTRVYADGGIVRFFFAIKALPRINATRLTGRNHETLAPRPLPNLAFTERSIRR